MFDEGFRNRKKQIDGNLVVLSGNMEEANKIFFS